MSEVGVGYVKLMPSMRGFSAEVSRGLRSELGGVGKTAGGMLGTGLADGAVARQSAVRSAAGKLGGAFKTGLAGVGLAAGALVVTGFVSALDQGAAVDKLEAQIGAGSVLAEELGDAAGRLYIDAFGDSVADTGKALQLVKQSGLLDADADIAAIEGLTAQALTFSDVMDQDLSMSLQAVQSMMRSGLIDTPEEGFNVLTRGIQTGTDKAGDLGETFQEYSTIFRELGIDATTATGLMNQGLDGGARDADKVADALKEVSIRAKDGSRASAEGFALLGLNADMMTAKFAAGGASASEGLGQVLDALRAMEDPVARNAAAVALFGTQAEDLGAALFSLDVDTAASELGVVTGATDKLGHAYDNAATRIEAFKRGAMMGLSNFIGNRVLPELEKHGPALMESFRPLGDALADLGPELMDALVGLGPVLATSARAATPLVSGLAKLLTMFGEADPKIQMVIVGLGGLVKVGGPLLSVVSKLPVGFGSVVGLATKLGPLVVGLGKGLMSLALGLGPIGLIGIAVAGLGILIWKNFDTIKRVAGDAWGWIRDKASSAFGWIKENWPLLLGIIGGPIGIAAALVITHWDGIKAGATRLKDAIGRSIGGIVSFFAGLPDRVQAFPGQAFGYVRSAATSAKDWVVRRGDDIVSWFKGLPGAIGRAMGGLRNKIVGPFADEINGLIRVYNAIPGLSDVGLITTGGGAGRSFSPTSTTNSTIRRYHDGGIVGPEGSRAGEVEILAQVGEGVFTPGQMAAIGAGFSHVAASPNTVEVRGDGLIGALIEEIRRAVRVEGGDVQVVLGGG